MRPIRSAFALLLFTCGCQAIQVERMANRLTSTVPDLYEREVLNNLAMLAAKPSAIPYFGLVQQGTSANTRTVSANYMPGWDMITASGYFLGRTVFDKQTAQFQGQFANADTFQMAPISDPDKLLLIQAAIHKVLNIPTEYDAMLNFFFSTHSPWAHYEQMTQPGWFIVGKKKDVPKHACYVGRYCDTYVWVPPERVADLTRFTFAILDIATIASIPSPVLKQGGYGAGQPMVFPPRILPFPYPAPPAPPS
jgi:hypothetical protein